jgi:hypothetical protein
LITILKEEKQTKKLQKFKQSYRFRKKNVKSVHPPQKKEKSSQQFCLMTVKSMEDGKRHQGFRPCNFIDSKFQLGSNTRRSNLQM